MKRTGFLAVVIVLMIIASPLFLQMGNYSSIENELVTQSVEGKTPIERTVHLPSYELHDRISISDDLDWVEQGIPGSGTEADPYVIENLEIKSNSECIFIIYTSMHYIVRNCLLWSDSFQGEGIHINHADHGLVENCTVMMKDYGIFVMNTNGLVIRNNSMYDLDRHGVRLSTASNCNVTQNVIRDTLDNGIYCQSSNCRIENNTIWNSSEDAIYMFQCSNSIVLSNSLSNSSAGSYLESCDSITFANNTMFNNDELGFRNYDSDNCIFSNNSIYDTDGYGVMWNRGDDSSITGNHIRNNSLYGFYLYYSRNCNLSTNFFENDGLAITGSEILDWKHNINDNTVNGKVLGYFYNSTDALIDGSVYGQIIVVNCTGLKIQGGVMFQTDIGIALYYSENCTVNSTSIKDEIIGIFLYGSEYCNITNSVLDNCGISINGGALSQWIHNFTGTTVNGKSVGYFFEKTDLTLDDDSLGQIIVVNSTGITINNYGISNASQSLTFAYSSDCNISENNLSGNYIGVRLYDCSNILFENTSILNSINCGVLVYYSDNCTFNNVTAQDATYGIYISGSSECSISESKLSHNEYGVYLRSSTLLNVSHCMFENNYEAFYLYYLDNSTIYDCQVLTSKNYGLRVYDSNWIILRECKVLDNLNHGIFFYYSHYGTILSNNVSNNGFDGISLFGSDYCLIVNNTVGSNSEYGINAHVFSDYNIIYGNNITSNAGGNGYGYQSTNTWDDSVSIGNYWSDYHGPGVYSIAGPGSNVDRYPQGPAVVLSAHSDVNFLLTMSGASFTWDSFSTEPDNYIIFVEGVIYDQGVWDGSEIDVDVDTTTLGVYNYTLFINGTSGNYMIDTVMVTIYDNNPTINSPPNYGYNYDTTGHSIVWNPSDYNPYGFYVFHNSDLIDFGIWNGLAIEVTIDGLPIGIHNYTLLVNDTSGNSISDSVQITVWDTEPFLDSPYGNITYTEGSTGHAIYWNASDFNPANYTVFKNSSIDSFSSWNGEPILYSVDGLVVGVYNYTILVVDTSGQLVYDTVFVSVQSVTTTTTTTTTTTNSTTTTTTSTNSTSVPINDILILTVSIASIAVIFIVAIMIFKKRS